MSDLSPKLLERRRLREIRCRPWKDIQPASPVPISRRSILGNPVITSSRIPILRKSYPLPNRPVPESIKAEYKRSGPFPFLKLPVEIQLLVGEYVVQYQTSIKCKDFLPRKDDTVGKTPGAIPKKRLSKHGYPVWIPLLKVCPWLSRDLSRTWYRHNAFYVKSVPEWNEFVTRATWENVNRIEQLNVDNEFIFYLGESISKGSDWRSYSLIAPLKNLKTLMLYRDDGGPTSYTSGGHDDFNSVEWFVNFATDCKTLQHIRFALHPWAGFTTYPLTLSNMVVWIKDWEHEWNAVMTPRRIKGTKPPPSWCMDISPNARSQLVQGRRGNAVTSL